MNDLLQIALLSIVQGITEFLPISSSAHLIVIRKFFDWDSQGLLIDVSLHFGSLLAVSLYYIKNSHEFKDINSTENYINLYKIFIGSVPVLFFAYLFQDHIENNLRTIEIISIFSILIAIFLLMAEFLKKDTKKLLEINNLDMLIIGFAQAIALIPGTSRAGIIILSAILLGYDKKSAIVIALVLSFPVIFIAMLHQVYSLEYELMNINLIIKICLSITLSFAASYFVIKYFLSYINKIGLYPFMVYRLIFGIALLIFLT